MEEKSKITKCPHCGSVIRVKYKQKRYNVMCDIFWVIILIVIVSVITYTLVDIHYRSIYSPLLTNEVITDLLSDVYGSYQMIDIETSIDRKLMDVTYDNRYHDNGQRHVFCTIRIPERGERVECSFFLSYQTNNWVLRNTKWYNQANVEINIPEGKL